MAGKTVVITSGTSGIGACIVKKIFSEAEVEQMFINYGHDDAAAERLKAELPESVRERVHLVKADMSTEEGLAYLIGEIQARAQQIDWLICNTGIGTYKKFEEYTIEMWNHILTTNVTIPVFLIKGLKKLFRKGGKIVFMSSYAGIVPYSSSLVYGTSKAAVCFIAKALLKEFDGQNVAVNAIAPGFIETRWQDGRSDESRERINAKVASHRFGKPEEVAKLCYDILTNDYINGTVIEITGGYGYF